jgi:hypothetical protein
MVELSLHSAGIGDKAVSVMSKETVCARSDQEDFNGRIKE